MGIASIPDEIRGYGHIKLRTLKTAKANEANLLTAFRSPRTPAKAA